MSERQQSETLNHTLREAAWRGDYESALAAADQGLALARTRDDRLAEEIFLCNRATVWIEMEKCNFNLGRLKGILLGSSSRFNAALASYVVASAEESRDRFDRAGFYAQMAISKSEDLGNMELLGASLALVGRLQMREGRFREARESFRKALGVLEATGELSPMAALVSDELGYCCVVLQENGAGFSYLERSLAAFERLGLKRAMDYPSLDMCFARLKNDDLEEAEIWGRRALALGLEFGLEDIIKNSHYLLAESCWRLGRRSDADHHYDALARYYPEFPRLKDYLQQVDLTSMLNIL